MYRNHSIGVVIPAYNEAGFVGDVIETIPAYVDRVYVIDDGSTDGTWEEIQAASQRVNEEVAADNRGQSPFDRRVVPIRHGQNRGVGGAIKTGYQRARDDRINVTAVMGGDGQMRPTHLDRVLDPVVEGRADYAKGNRLAGSDTRDGMPRFRQVGNYILSGLTKIASGYWDVGDPQNGYTAISLQALDAIDLDEMYEFYGYCNDLLVKLNVHGFRVEDVPRECNYADEESHIDYRTYIPRVSAMLLRNFLWRLREQYLRGHLRPAALCYTMGMTTGIVGTLLASAEAVSNGRQSRGVANALRTTMVGCLVFVLGSVIERRDATAAPAVSDARAVEERDATAIQMNSTERPETATAHRTTNGANAAATQDSTTDAT